MKFVIGLTTLLILLTVIIGVIAIYKEINGIKLKRFLGFNFIGFIALLIGATVFILNGHTAMAADTATAAATSASGLKYIAAALSTGIGSIGAGIAVAVTGSSAIGAISENPKLFGKSIIYVGLAEGIAIYGLIIAIMILAK